VLEYHVDKVAQRRNMWWYRGEAKVGGDLVVEAELGAYLVKE
jgi:3-hydroxyacyl-[acyl-carrier-protein] dehydratase